MPDATTPLAWQHINALAQMLDESQRPDNLNDAAVPLLPCKFEEAEKLRR